MRPGGTTPCTAESGEAVPDERPTAEHRKAAGPDLEDETLGVPIRRLTAMREAD
jgi:hypothetical protein